MSLWDSEDAVRVSASDDISRAVVYREDDAWPVSRDLYADHWEVVGDVRATAPASDTRHPAEVAG